VGYGYVSDTAAGEMKPSPARMYDYYLGGHHNFPVDRQAADEVMAAFPDMPIVAQANRAFLRRAVRFVIERGVCQFLDIGSGIPTVGNVHEVAQGINPDARVVYVDVDPIAVTHGRALLANNPLATVVQADARDVDQLVANSDVRRLLDFSQPVAVLIVAMLHFVHDDLEARQIISRLFEVVAPGSYFVFSHALSEETDLLTPEILAATTSVYKRSTAVFAARSRLEIQQLLAPLELVEPGLVYVPLWRPEGPDDVLLEAPERSSILAAVGRKR
jgi:SAM-dependent methyltransferase